MGENNKCCALSLGLTLGIVWAGAILLTGIANRFCPPYAYEFLKMVDSIYPGYHAQTGLRNLPIGVIWGFFDGFIGGFIIAWIYNLVGKRKSKSE